MRLTTTSRTAAERQAKEESHMYRQGSAKFRITSRDYDFGDWDGETEEGALEAMIADSPALFAADRTIHVLIQRRAA